MKTGGFKALAVAAGVAAAALGAVAWLDGGKCNGFGDWAEHALGFFEDDTVWAEGYSEEGFAKIEPGMTCEEVVRLAGRPLYEWWGGEGTECLGRNVQWDYAQRGGAGWVRRVYFEDDGRMVAWVLRGHYSD